MYAKYRKGSSLERWYNDRNLLLAAVEEYGSVDAAARAIGGASISTVQKAYRRLGLPQRPPGPTPKGQADREALNRLAKKVYGGA